MKEHMLKGKVAVVTGGTRGRGYATVKKLLEECAKVSLCGSKESTAVEALQKVMRDMPDSEVMAIWPNHTH